MNLPTTFATDSTKKFFFILGVLLIGYSTYKVNNINTDFSDNARVIDSLNLVRYESSKQFDLISEAIPQVKAERERIIDSLAISFEKSKEYIRKHYFPNVNDSMMLAYQAEYKKTLENTHIPLYKAETYRKFRKRYLTNQLLWLALPLIYGLILSFYGYQSWKKEETIKDKILQRQLDLLNLEYEQKSKVKISEPTRYIRR